MMQKEEKTAFRLSTFMPAYGLAPITQSESA
jgi:hypothetical protein